MGLNGILSSSLTALQTNTAALRVVSQNISNLNTANYARRQVNQAALGAAGIPEGVTIEDVTRVADQFLTQESLSATSSASQYDSQSNLYDQITGLLGQVGDGSSLSSKLSSVFSKLGQAALSTSSTSSQSTVVTAFKSLAGTISSMSSSLDNLSSQVDGQIVSSVTTTNGLIKQIYDYNNLIKSAAIRGDTDTTYLDQRATALSSLAQKVDIRVNQQDDGTIQVSTKDGLGLVGSTYATLSYSPSQTGTYGSIMVQDTNGTTGQPIGTSQVFDPHLNSGAIRGLLDVRDNAIAGVKNELGSFAQTVANSFNAIHNQNSAYPPPTSMTGHNTGLLASDSLNFSGKANITLTNASGVQQSTVAIDFGAGTITAGGSTTNFSPSIGDFASKLDSALGTAGGGSASFSDGVLSISGGSNGLVVSDDSTTPSSCAGAGFSQFFGLNDLFTSSVPSLKATGVSGFDACGGSGQIAFVVKNASGAVAKSVSVSVASVDSFNTVLSNINSALGGTATVTLNSDGSVSTSVAASYPGYSLQVSNDSTLRGTTGLSITDVFGIGSNAQGKQASGFTVTSDIAGDSSRIALAKPDFTTSQVVGSGDSNGLLALQNLATTKCTFARAGNLSGQSTTLQNYAAALYQDVATQSSNAASNKTTQDDRLTEANSRLASNSGVNLDEELSNMIIYQQAYSAGARLLTVVGQLYDTLLGIK